MDSVVSWKIRGLHWPNKQEDVKVFLKFKKLRLVGLHETKVKMENVNTVANLVIGGWQSAHNFHLNVKWRIWVAWRPS